MIAITKEKAPVTIGPKTPVEFGCLIFDVKPTPMATITSHSAAPSRKPRENTLAVDSAPLMSFQEEPAQPTTNTNKASGKASVRPSGPAMIIIAIKYKRQPEKKPRTTPTAVRIKPSERFRGGAAGAFLIFGSDAVKKEVKNYG